VPQEPSYAPPNHVEDLHHLRVAWGARWMEREPARPGPAEHAVEDQRVEVHVQVKSAAEALDDREHAGAAIADAIAVGLAPVESE